MAANMFGNNAQLMSGAQQAQAQNGQPVGEIIADGLAFKSLSGDTKLRVLPSPWPEDNLPPPTASLLAIASTAGLIAAVDPSNLVVAKTTDVREALASKQGVQDGVKTFDGGLKISLGLRVSQVVFSSDDRYLVISAQDGGGLQVYETESLMKGNTQHAFQIGTENIGVRALAPNPATGHLLAVVLTDGKLMMADLNAREFSKTTNGSPLLRDAGVSCCSWSAKGKQLVAGLEDASAVQFWTDGRFAAAIPKPPDASNCYVAAMSWLGNDVFMNIYNVNAAEAGSVPEYKTYLVMRKNDAFSFRPFEFEPASAVPNDLNRIPPQFFISRIREYEPSLKDVLIVTSTCSPDVGLIANSASPLSREAPNITNEYGLVGFPEDTRKAALPSSANSDPNAMGMSDPSPIGMALDLSSNEPVSNPIPQEETLQKTAMPLPALVTLNHEGVLSAWWFIYNEAILQNKTYKNMAVVQSSQPQSALVTATPPSQPAFGQSGFSAFKTSTMGVSQPPPGPTSSSPWSNQQSATKFGQPSFGAPSLGSSAQPSFGTPAALGSNQKVFGGGTALQGSSPFAKAAQDGAKSGTSPFGAFASSDNKSSAASPFGNVNKTSQSSLFNKSSTSQVFGSNVEDKKPDWGFGEPDKKEQKSTVFGQQPSFGSTMTIGSSFGSISAPSALGNKSPWETPSLSNNTSDGVKSGDSKPQDEDADMDMDKKLDTGFDNGMAGLGLGDQKPKNETKNTDKQAQPGDGAQDESKQTKPAKEVEAEKQPMPADAPLPPDPFTKSLTPSSAEQKSDEHPLPPEPEALPSSPDEDNAKETMKPGASEQTASATQPAETPEKKKETADTQEAEKSTTPKSPTETPAKERNKSSEPSPAGSPPELVEAERSIPASPTKSITSDVNDTHDLSKAGTWPRQKSPMQSPTPRQLFGEQTPTGPLSFNTKTPPSALTQPPVRFDPPGESPRSPSPVRQQPPGRRIASPTRRSGLSPTRSQRASPERAVSSPGPIFAPTPQPPHAHRPSKLQQQITPSKSSPAPAEIAAPVRAASPVPSVDFAPAEEAEEAVHEELASTIERSKNLKEFIAHQGYVDDVNGNSIASQLERLYRDGNSMVDTLGLNSRTLQAFILGQFELYKERGRELADLEPEEHASWVFEEVDHLFIMEKDMVERLMAEREPSVKEMLLELRDTHHETVKMRRKGGAIAHEMQEIRSFLGGDGEGNVTGRVRGKLSSQQAGVLRDLRQQYVDVQSLLVKAEDASALLKAKIVAREAADGEDGPRSEVPTYEAVVNTIAKMTRMAEQKRSNVDVLEARLRKLQKAGAIKTNAEDLGMSQLSIGSNPRRSVRYSTPPESLKKSTTNGTPSKIAGYGLQYSDDESEEDGTNDGVLVKRDNSEEDDDLAKSTQALSIQRGQHLSGLSTDELEELAERRAHRRRILQKFGAQVIARGNKITDRTKS